MLECLYRGNHWRRARMCWRYRQAGERQRQIKDDGFILDGCWARSSCWPFCLSCGHSTPPGSELWVLWVSFWGSRMAPSLHLKMLRSCRNPCWPRAATFSPTSFMLHVPPLLSPNVSDRLSGGAVGWGKVGGRVGMCSLS